MDTNNKAYDKPEIKAIVNVLNNLSNTLVAKNLDYGASAFKAPYFSSCATG